MHHYVPRLLLRNFRGGTKKRIHVFDKHTGRSFATSEDRIAAERGFYDLPGFTHSPFERALGIVESETAGVLKRLVTSQSLADITKDERGLLALFGALQFVRVPFWRIQYEQVNRLFREAMATRGIDPDKVGLTELTPEQVKEFGLSSLSSSVDFMPYLLEKDWILMRASTASLYISDNPLVLHNSDDHRPYGNLGLAVRGVQLYLPLSGTLALCMCCPSLRSRAESALSSAQSPLRLHKGADEAVKRLSGFAQALRTSATIHASQANVDHLNSLQVRSSARYIFSPEANFGLAREMLRDHPELSSGASLEIA